VANISEKISKQKNRNAAAKKKNKGGVTVLSGDPAPSFPAAMTTKKSSLVAVNLIPLHKKT
jgi:hypothetical protein